MYRQGDVLIVPIAPRLINGEPVTPVSGRVVLARGEATGHHHSFGAGPTVALFRPDDMPAGSVVLVISGEAPATLEHQEHTALAIAPGWYEVRRQREYAPEAIRMVED